MQTRPGAQSLSSAHAVRHVEPSSSQRYGSQLCGAGKTHVALPLHCGAGVWALFAQYSTPQVTDWAGSTQLAPLVPSQ